MAKFFSHKREVVCLVFKTVSKRSSKLGSAYFLLELTRINDESEQVIKKENFLCVNAEGKRFLLLIIK